MSDEHDDQRGAGQTPEPPAGETGASGGGEPSQGGQGGQGGPGGKAGGGRRRRGRSRRGRRGGGEQRQGERERSTERESGAGRPGADEQRRAGAAGESGAEPSAEPSLDYEGEGDEDELSARDGETLAGAGSSAAPRPEMALVVYLARSGVGSRRRCDELIREGKVTIGGTAITFPREKVPSDAEVTVEGETVELRELRYVLVNKPRGVASTRSDPHADRVLVDVVPDGRTLFPVGRLDVDTTGLIILTNDGVLANRLMHPRYGVPKTYVARVRGRVGKRALAELRTGVELEDGRTAPAEARLEKQGNKTALVELTIHEGHKRQVKRMLAAVGLPVEELHRRRYGPLSDKNLKVGAWRQLSGDEVEALRRAGEESDRRAAADDPGDAVDLAASQERPAKSVEAVATPAEPAAATEMSEPPPAPGAWETSAEPLEPEEATEPSDDEPAAGPSAADEPPTD